MVYLYTNYYDDIDKVRQNDLNIKSLNYSKKYRHVI